MGKAGLVIYRRLLVASIIAMLVFPILGIKTHNFIIRERPQSITRPAQLWNGFVKREWQQFLEQRFLSHMGSLRSFLILSYNEAKHRLFPTRPNDNYLWTQQFGYYPVDTIRRLNYDVLHHGAIKQHYQLAARRLRILQELLGHHGVTLLVVVAPPKVRLYPEYATPYLIAPTETIMSRAVSYGDVLQESGVNVINVERLFSERKATSLPFFTTTSFHWNYWAGCTVADEIMQKAEALTGRPAFRIECSDVEYGKSKGTDTDIAVTLNIFSTEAIIGDAPFPKIAAQRDVNGEIPKIVLIGDSFSDQLVYALTKALPAANWSPGWLTRYDNFTYRQTFGARGEASARVPLQRSEALSEILTKELLVIEVSDGAVYRDDANLHIMEYGATQTLLDGLLTRTDAGVIDPKSVLTDGWRTLGNEQWQAVGPRASFAIRALAGGNPVPLTLDVENLAPGRDTPRLLTVSLDGKSIGEATIAGGRAVLEVTVPGTDEWDDSLVAEISLRDTSGRPLDILLHGIRLADADTAKKAQRERPTTVLPSTRPLDRAGLRAINLFRGEAPEDISVDGLSGLESNGKDNWRWALGPAMRIKFYVDPAWPEQARQVLLKFAFLNGVPIPDQTVIIRLNGEDIRRFSSEEIGVQKQVNADTMLSTKAGLNVVEIVYGDWNHGKKHYGPADPRQLAVAVTRLSLQGANK
jgi:SGNH hydrolase-like domain, acetyltransferase AlgX